MRLQLAAPLSVLGLAACLLDTSGLQPEASSDDVATATTTSGSGGSGGAATSATTSASSPSSTSGMGGTGGDSTVGVGGGGGDVVGWEYRQPLVVNTNGPVPVGYSVFIDIDHQALVTAGQAAADGSDLFVVYDGGSSLEAIDRVIDPESAWNLPATRIWFETRAPIAGESSDGDYYLYWKHLAPPPVPADANLVFQVFDGFDAAPVGAAWSIDEVFGAFSSAMAIVNGHLRITVQNEGQIYGPQDDFVFVHRAASGNIAVRAKMSASGGALDGYAIAGGAMIRESNGSSDRFRMAAAGTGAYLPMYGNRVSTRRLTSTGESSEVYATAPALHPVVLEVARSGLNTAASHSADGLSFQQLGGVETFSQFPMNVRVGIAFTNDDDAPATLDVDWFLVRRFVPGEPTVTTSGAPEMGVFTLP